MSVWMTQDRDHVISNVSVLAEPRYLRWLSAAAALTT